MTTAVAVRRHPVQPRPGSLPSFLAALAMHAALVGSMWFAMQWKTSVSAPASAELWELPSTEVATPPPAPLPEPTPPASPPPPVAEAPEPAKPDIVEKREAKRPDTPPRKDNVPAKKKAKPAPKAPTAAELRRQQAEADKRYAEELKRLTSQAGNPSPTPAVTRAGPISKEWAARITSAVLANLHYAVPEGVDPAAYAEFRVDLLPDGEQAGEPVLTKPSGVPGFDDAARRAILRTDPFPRKSDGSVDRRVVLQLHPQDLR